ncbi:DUF4937 domain-containing protein [Bacillus sp. 165]|uniref:DUF4937 domain-containing protein n=1 Tax=Bacillus sp. 165 TaxID=1529117 RepID=UPI001ADCF7B1|nr:DUF4937 domain-containing protein [Bacillus sp. 165]MBO9129656.1 DUF4937 domain-containing protein [Bacillus sp. 165]
MKWIVCSVPNEQTETFSAAQERWKELENIAGFQWQIGGWTKIGEACILACWKNQNSYDNFMKQIHDQTYLQSNHQNTYDSISVTLYEGITSPTNIIPLLQTKIQLFAEEITRIPEKHTYLIAGKNILHYLIAFLEPPSSGKHIII